MGEFKVVKLVEIVKMVEIVKLEKLRTIFVLKNKYSIVFKNNESFVFAQKIKLKKSLF